jgi:hypothetical protein
MNRRDVAPPFKPEPDRAHCSPDHELQEQFFGEDRNKDPPLTAEQQKQFENYDYNTDLKNKEKKHPVISGPVDDNLEDIDLTKELEHDGPKASIVVPASTTAASESHSKSLVAATQTGSDVRRSSSESLPTGDEKHGAGDKSAHRRHSVSKSKSKNSQARDLRDDGSDSDGPERVDSGKKEAAVPVPGSADNEVESD